MVLEPMAESSDMVAEAIRRPGNANFKTGGVTAREWFERRIKGRRVKNWKVYFESSRVGWDIHRWEHLGTRVVEGRPRNGTQRVGLLRGRRCFDT